MEPVQSNENYVALDITTEPQEESQQKKKNEIPNGTNGGQKQQQIKYKRGPPRNKNFDNRGIRANFIMKVYISLSIELLVTIGLMILKLQLEKKNHPYCKFSDNSQPSYYFWRIFGSTIVSFILHTIVFQGGPKMRQQPWNYIIMVLYILFFGYLIITIYTAIVYEFGVVVLWYFQGATLIFALTLTIYIYQTKNTISYQVGSIYLIVSTLIIMIILMGVFRSNYLSIFVCWLAIILQGLYLIYETKRIIRDHILYLSIGEYVVMSVLLYAIIIQFLQRIMRWINAIKSGKAGQEIIKEYKKNSVKKLIKKKEEK